MPTKEFTFRNSRFLVEIVPIFFPQHPSWFSFVDEHEVRDRNWRIEPGDCVFDVGAAYGSYTMCALASGAAMAFAWSPQGFAGDKLTEAGHMRATLRHNEWEDKCMVMESGIYSRPGWINCSTQHFYEERPEPHPDIIEVAPLDDWYRRTFRAMFSAGQFPRYWLKLDVEGAEVEVLRSAELLIAELRPNILVENHNFKRPTIEQEVRELLTGAKGYREESTVAYHSVSHSLYLPTA